jgi:hypothetical protein
VSFAPYQNRENSKPHLSGLAGLFDMDGVGEWCASSSKSNERKIHRYERGALCIDGECGANLVKFD